MSIEVILIILKPLSRVIGIVKFPFSSLLPMKLLVEVVIMILLFFDVVPEMEALFEVNRALFSGEVILTVPVFSSDEKAG